MCVREVTKGIVPASDDFAEFLPQFPRILCGRGQGLLSTVCVCVRERESARERERDNAREERKKERESVCVFVRLRVCVRECV